jgi:hypothetical protein
MSVDYTLQQAAFFLGRGNEHSVKIKHKFQKKLIIEKTPEELNMATTGKYPCHTLL